MSTRIYSPAAVALVLAACKPAPDDVLPDKAEGDEHIACALGGSGAFNRQCAIERAEVEGKPILVVRHPDGAFRRFELVDDGRGLAVADGAEDAQIQLSGETLDVTVGADRYRFPATKMSHAGNP